MPIHHAEEAIHDALDRLVAARPARPAAPDVGSAVAVIEEAIADLARARAALQAIQGSPKAMLDFLRAHGADAPREEDLALLPHYKVREILVKLVARAALEAPPRR